MTKVVDRFIPFNTDLEFRQHSLLVKAYLRVPQLWRFFGSQFVIVEWKPALADHSTRGAEVSQRGNGLQGGL